VGESAGRRKEREKRKEVTIEPGDGRGGGETRRDQIIQKASSHCVLMVKGERETLFVMGVRKEKVSLPERRKKSTENNKELSLGK